MTNREKKLIQRQKRRNRIILVLSLLLFAYIISVVATTRGILNVRPLGNRTEEQEKILTSTLDLKYPERNSIFLSTSPFAAPENFLSLNAKSAIMVDVTTGSVVYEKNADQQIPPASMTKIVEMYVVYQALESGEISLDDIVPLPAESWEENIPWDATRMHLAQGQVVTLRELLLGLAIASANDASIAVANYVCGSMDDFVDRMNKTVESMGLTKTHFVESSGYSEENITTAREFATFARQYIMKFPQALKDFHSQLSFRYPEKKNVPDQEEVLSYKQYNTNKLLEKIAGCDGLKTGYIDESGYNISVTAEQNGTRFLSVTMGGPGNNSREGNSYRVQDNLNLFDFAFSNYLDYRVSQEEGIHEYTVGVFGGKNKSVRLVPAKDETFTVPIPAGDETVVTIDTEARIPRYILGKVECGKQYGEIAYKINGKVFRTIPLVADRDIQKSNPISFMVGKTCSLMLDLCNGKPTAY